MTLDGEAVCLRDDGRPDFHALLSKRACRDAVFVAFDVLAVDGADIRSKPLSERRRLLADLLDGWADDRLLFSGHVEGDQSATLLRHACVQNLEGIVSKRLNAPYRSGPFSGWRKIKCPDYRRP